MAQSVVILCNRSSIIIQVTVFILQHVDSVFFFIEERPIFVAGVDGTVFSDTLLVSVSRV